MSAALTPRSLDRLLGDPWDADQPFGHAAILEADERREPPADGARLLTGAGYLAEFVPVGLGGRLTGADRLARLGRQLFGRDPALGLACSAPLIGATNVWTAGPDTHRRRVADLLLAGRTVAIAYTELAHGNDFAHGDLSARPGSAGQLLLAGSKELITNYDTADALVLLARTGGDGPRSHSLLLVDPHRLDPWRWRRSARFGTAGMRGLRLGGLEFDDCPVPADAVLGAPGHALDTAMRAFQVTRSVLAGMCTGTLDAALRTAVRCTGRRTLFGGPVAAMPHVREILVTSFVDLLVADCLATTVTRALHVHPEAAPVYAAAAKYLVPTRVAAALDELASVLGAEFYQRDGEYGIFQKLLRDAAPARFAHSAPAVCLSTMLPQLPRLARRSWPDAQPVSPALFDLRAALPALSFDRLVLAATADPVAGARRLALETAGARSDPRVRALAEALDGEFDALGDEVRELHFADLAMGAGPAALDLCARYAVLLSAGACLGVWLANRGRAGAFFTGTEWLVAALTHTLAQLGRGPLDLAPATVDALYGELSARCGDDRSLEIAELAADD